MGRCLEPGFCFHIPYGVHLQQWVCGVGCSNLGIGAKQTRELQSQLQLVCADAQEWAEVVVSSDGCFMLGEGEGFKNVCGDTHFSEIQTENRI